jgi:tetratricopeptide (TPR) repeat protein
LLRAVPFVCALLWAGSAVAETPACQPGAQGRIDVQACADAAPKGSPERQLALINLGTQAVRAQDYAAAVRFYDEAQPPGAKDRIFSDPSFHAYRAEAYDRVGRRAEGLADARTALAMLSDARWKALANGRDVDPEVVLERILPILKRGGDAGYPAALKTYLGLPARDWISHANRAGVLMDLEEYASAEAANAEALKLQPGHPAVLNNACYLLAKTGRAAEGVPYCLRAVSAAPDVAAVHDSYAVALTALGDCDLAEAELGKARQLDSATVEYRRKLDCKPR